MNSILTQIETLVYTPSSLTLSDYKIEAESNEYDACRFSINNYIIICRNAKVTPKKIGQFVTFWKRNNQGVIEPFNYTAPIDFYVVNVKSGNNFGQFVFPKSILIKKGIISSKIKEGKRAFRVYPKWDITKNKQAIKTQKWQLDYFYEINDSIDLNKVLKLYKIK